MRPMRPGPGGRIPDYDLGELIDQASLPWSDRSQFAREFERRGLDIDDYVPETPEKG